MINERQGIIEKSQYPDSQEVVGATKLLQNLESQARQQDEFADLATVKAAGPEVKIANIEELFALAVSNQSKLDLALEQTQAAERRKKLAEIRSSLDETLGVVSLERLIVHAEGIGISRQAITEAHKALSFAEVRKNTLAELEKEFGLPEGAGAVWVKEERVIRGWVERVREEIPEFLNTLAHEVEKYPDATMDLGELNLGKLGHASRAGIVDLDSLKRLSFFAIPLIGQVCFLSQCYHGKLLVLSPNLKSLHSPSLNALKQEVEVMGGKLSFQSDAHDCFFGYEPREGLIVRVSLSLPTSRELKN